MTQASIAERMRHCNQIRTLSLDHGQQRERDAVTIGLVVAESSAVQRLEIRRDSLNLLLGRLGSLKTG